MRDMAGDLKQTHAANDLLAPGGFMDRAAILVQDCSGEGAAVGVDRNESFCVRAQA